MLLIAKPPPDSTAHQKLPGSPGDATPGAGLLRPAGTAPPRLWSMLRVTCRGPRKPGPRHQRLGLPQAAALTCTPPWPRTPAEQTELPGFSPCWVRPGRGVRDTEGRTRLPTPSTCVPDTQRVRSRHTPRRGHRTERESWDPANTPGTRGPPRRAARAPGTAAQRGRGSAARLRGASRRGRGRASRLRRRRSSERERAF